MESCRYIVARFVPDLVRDEPLNIGVILQCVSRKFIDCRFLEDFRRITQARPEVEARLLRAFSREFRDRVASFSNPFSQPFIPEPPEHQSVIDPAFLDDIAAQYGNRFQFTSPRGTLATDPVQELNHLFDTFVAERRREVKRQRLTHYRLREKLHALFDRSQLLAARLVQQPFIIPGKVKQDGWQFDFGRDDHNISIYQSLALDVTEEEDKIDRAMVLRGRIQDVKEAVRTNGKRVEAYALTYFLSEESHDYVGSTEARKILLEGDVEVIRFEGAADFVAKLRAQLLG